MTIISDCNNNQLEVSVTSNGLKVSTLNNNGTVNGQQLPIEPPPPPPVSLNEKESINIRQQILRPNSVNNCHKLNGSVECRNGTRQCTESTTATPSLVQRHQSCPGQSQQIMIPRRQSRKQQHQQQKQQPQKQLQLPSPPVLPEIDNCDSIIQSLPATRLDQPSGGRPARGTKAIAPAHLKRNTIHGLYLNPNDNDWKAKLNHELTLYQKLLQEQTSQMGSSQMANDEQKPIRINENGWYRHKELDRIIKTEDQPIRTDVQEKILTPYECILHAMQYDKAWHKEISMGRRIGFYRFKGEIGNGNFSQVKVAVHSLTKGLFIDSIWKISHFN